MTLQPTAIPVRPFLDWPVVTDPSKWDAEVALLGIPRSEPFPKDPQPNDQSRAPDAIRSQSKRFCYSPGNWDFDTGIDPASALPATCLDLGNVPWITPYDNYAAYVTERIRYLWRQRAQVVILGGDHGVTIPVLDALDAVGEPVHVLQIDAHLDWREEVDGVRRGYSSPLRIGMDIVEVAPAFDSANGITCLTAGRLILNVLVASWAADGAWRRGR